MNYKLGEWKKFLKLWAIRGLLVIFALVIIFLFALLFYMGGSYGIAGFIIILFSFWFMIKHVNNIKVIASGFLALWDFQSRLAVKYQIEGHVNKQIVCLTKECEELCPSGELHIEWTEKTETAKTFIEDGKPVVRLAYHKNSDVNLSRIMYSYIKDAICFNVKPFVDERVFDTTTLALSRGLLEGISPETGRYFVNTVVHPSLNEDEETLALYHNIYTLYECGFLTPIALPEFNETRDHHAWDVAPRWLKEESVDVIDYLIKKTYSKDEELALTGTESSFILEKKHYKFALIKVTAYKTYSESGLTNHKSAINYAIEAGAKNIYICGRGKRNIGLVKQLITYYSNDRRIKNYKIREFKAHKPNKQSVIGVLQNYTAT